VLVNGEVIRWNVGDLILGHDWLSLNAGMVSRRFVKNLRDLDGHDAGGGVGSAAQDVMKGVSPNCFNGRSWTINGALSRLPLRS
jgi:hypothetical protein